MEALQHDLQQQADEENLADSPRAPAHSGGSWRVSNSVADQIAQITKAPRMAPRLLPDPPTISITHRRKVAVIGSVASGPM